MDRKRRAIEKARKILKSRQLANHLNYALSYLNFDDATIEDVRQKLHGELDVTISMTQRQRDIFTGCDMVTQHALIIISELILQLNRARWDTVSGMQLVFTDHIPLRIYRAACAKAMKIMIKTSQTYIDHPDLLQGGDMGQLMDKDTYVITRKNDDTNLCKSVMIIFTLIKSF